MTAPTIDPTEKHLQMEADKLLLTGSDGNLLEVAPIGGDVTFSISSAGAITMSGDVSLDDLTVGDDVVITGSVSAADVTATTTVTAADLVATDDLTVGDDATITGSLAAADITATTTVTAADLIATDDVTVGDDLAVTGLATVGETLGVTGITTATGGLKVGTSENLTIAGIHRSADVAVTVPDIADAESDIVAVDVSGAFTVQPVLGDLVFAAPAEALPTDCILSGAYVTATDQITVAFDTKEGGAGVSTAAKNFKFWLIKAA